ncbi:hypothetical protein BH09SUM1_BH09SUM1_11880 [soil metagenome]
MFSPLTARAKGESAPVTGRWYLTFFTAAQIAASEYQIAEEIPMARRRAARGKKNPFGKKTVFGLLLSLFVTLAGGGAVYLRSPETVTAIPEKVEHAVSSKCSAATFVSKTFSEAPRGDVIVAQVKRVVDGDTIVVSYSGKEEKVRLLNVDTPESVHSDTRRDLPIGKRASDYTRSELENSQVKLELAPGGKLDVFGRRLAYVLRDGQNFNVELVREGWSPYYEKYGASVPYDADFRRAEREARGNRRGIWADADYLALMASQPAR